MLSPTCFINVFYLVLFCIHVCVDGVIKKQQQQQQQQKTTTTT